MSSKKRMRDGLVSNRLAAHLKLLETAMTTELEWIQACNAGDIDEEDVLRFDHNEQTYAIYHLRNGFFASDGWCTHERAHLADGLVLGDQIECPMHLGRFDIKTGDPLNPPVCKKLQLHPVKLQDGQVLIGLSAAGQS
jgi:3-phenylpropionate/trans-cinnamate dioxygenase ferredoxin component